MKPPSRAVSGQLSDKCLFERTADIGAQIEPLFDLLQQRANAAGQLGLDLRQTRKRVADERQIARAGAAGRHAGQQPLDIVNLLERLAQLRRRAQESATSSATASSRSLIDSTLVRGALSQSASSRAPGTSPYGRACPGANHPACRRGCWRQAPGCGAWPCRSPAAWPTNRAASRSM